MAKSNFVFNKTFLIISAVLLVAIVGGIFYFNSRNFPANSIAVINFGDEQLSIPVSTYDKIALAAQSQNVSLNKTVVLNQLAVREVLLAQARRVNIAPTADQVEYALTEQLKTLDSQGLNQALAQQNLSRSEFEKNLRDSLTEDLTLQLLFNEEVVAKLQISDEQLKSVYTSNPAQFAVPETISVKHILLCYEGAPQCASNLTKEQAQQSIIAIYQALQNNASFEQLASQYSTDTVSSKRGGDIGAISRGQTVASFETAAFATPVGQISLPFESPYGFHILEVYGHQAGQQLSYEQVAPQLKQQVIAQQANVLQQAYIAGLMSNAKVTIVG